MLERYGHGGDWVTAEERYGRPETGWLDFSANMNPAGPPEAVGAIFRDHWREIARYPDPAVRGLRAKLAREYGIPPEAVLVGNGAAELIDLAVRGIGPASALLAQPSFKEYEDALKKGGVAVRTTRLAKERDYLLTEAELDSAISGPGTPGVPSVPGADGPDCVFLGHPNNPTGRLVPRETIDRLRRNASLLLLDEAFMDFVPEEKDVSLIREAAESERLIVFRSMTKFYAIPGIRLGFMVAHPKRIAELRALQPPWSVNFLAQLIGEAVLDEREYAARTRAWLQEERPWLTGRLRSLGIEACPSDVNYLLGELPAASGWTARTLQDRLAGRGILIRDASLFQGLSERHFRIAVRLRGENERLLQELEQALSRGAPAHA
ncbi:threonine-phosphate decarboxylase [Cohnella xylanilytica]|uniref:threonine-phosphate decarboxylase CobD n=1 Tax=Cohnella xylanilytica TaxID=557555 RepID=UPI001B2980D2|nr:threonine-phosphate decarboxylase CobD [Cohnella xylanilytica]GIO10499.1 threonine-phosphate decarboxylase [Cohnella xylanilytica]